jgi:hypothetical protein
VEQRVEAQESETHRGARGQRSGVYYVMPSDTTPIVNVGGKVPVATNLKAETCMIISAILNL